MLFHIRVKEKNKTGETATDNFICWYTILDKNVQNLSSVFANYKGPDQPTRLHSLISTFDIPLLESIISKHATSKFLIYN